MKSITYERMSQIAMLTAQAATSSCLAAAAWLLCPDCAAAEPQVPQLPAAEPSNARASPVAGAAYDAYAGEAPHLRGDP